MAEQSKCKSCNADIIWCKSVHGVAMPLDAEPVSCGNIAIKDGIAHVMQGDLFEEMIDGPRYQSHFVSCPAADSHRKRKK